MSRWFYDCLFNHSPPSKLETYYYTVISQIIKLTIKSHSLNHFNDQEFLAYTIKEKLKVRRVKTKSSFLLNILSSYWFWALWSRHIRNFQFLFFFHIILGLEFMLNYFFNNLNCCEGECILSFFSLHPSYKASEDLGCWEILPI